jgi:uncharacterized protein (TIGR02453 family)
MLQPSTLDFLSQLKNNNEKPWFDANRKQYEAAKKNVETVTQQLIEGLSVIDPDIAGAHLKAKDCLMRIFRDVRFSTDKTPYKTNFFAYFSKGGRKSIHAGYYFGIESGGQSFSGGGIYMPMAPELAKVRQEIAYEWDRWQAITNQPEFIKTYPNGVKTTDRLSRPPQGYTADHPAIEVLKNKSFYVSCDFSDQALFEDKFIETVLQSFKAAMPLVGFLNRALD